MGAASIVYSALRNLKAITIFYLVAIVTVIVAYIFFGIDLLWLLGYLVILLITSFVPKRVFVQTAIALLLLVAAIYTQSTGIQLLPALLLTFLLVSTGIPGIAAYAFVMYFNSVFINSALLSSALGYISFPLLIILLILHIAKHFSDSTLKKVWFIPIIDIVPFITDLILTVIISYLVFTHVAQLYPAVQAGINYLIKIV